jgi:hypothetical protein
MYMLSKLLPIKISPAQYTELKIVANREKISMGALIREALQKELDRHKQRTSLSDLAHLAENFPRTAAKKTDDELLYDL